MRRRMDLPEVYRITGSSGEACNSGSEQDLMNTPTEHQGVFSAMNVPLIVEVRDALFSYPVVSKIFWRQGTKELQLNNKRQIR